MLNFPWSWLSIAPIRIYGCKASISVISNMFRESPPIAPSIFPIWLAELRYGNQQYVSGISSNCSKHFSNLACRAPLLSTFANALFVLSHCKGAFESAANQIFRRGAASSILLISEAMEKVFTFHPSFLSLAIQAGICRFTSRICSGENTR